MRIFNRQKEIENEKKRMARQQEEEDNIKNLEEQRNWRRREVRRQEDLPATEMVNRATQTLTIRELLPILLAEMQELHQCLNRHHCPERHPHQE